LRLLAWTETDPSPDQQHWGWIKFVWGLVVCNAMKNVFTRKIRARTWRYWVRMLGLSPPMFNGATDGG